MTMLRRSGRTPARRRWSSTTMRTPAPCCCMSCGSATSSSRVTWSRDAHGWVGRAHEDDLVAGERLGDELRARGHGADGADLELA